MGKGKFNDNSMNQAMRRLEYIQLKCLGTKAAAQQGQQAQYESDTPMDDFLRKKSDIVQALKRVREQIEERDALLARNGSRSQESITITTQIRKQLIDIKDNQMQQLQKLYDKDTKSKKKKNALSQDEIDDRQLVIEALQQEIEDVKTIERGGQPTTQGKIPLFKREQLLASNNIGRRGEMTIDENSRGLDDQTRMQYEKSDKEMDEKIRRIGKGVNTLHEIALDMRTELEVQNKMLDDIDNQMDKVTAHIDKSNKKLKALIQAYGGPERWCCKLFLVLILLAVFGYIYSVATHRR